MYIECGANFAKILLFKLLIVKQRCSISGAISTASLAIPITGVCMCLRKLCAYICRYLCMYICVCIHVCNVKYMYVYMYIFVYMYIYK